MIWRRLKSLSASLSRKPTPDWSAEHIRDAWFDAHFHHAANAVAEWVGPERLKRGRLLDFGCGDGITMLSLVLRHGAREVFGVDVSRTHEGLAKLAEREIHLRKLPPNLGFQRIEPGEHVINPQPFDAIMSWSTFEHIEHPYMRGILANIRELLAPDGVFFLQISPLFFSPQGSHLGRFQLPAWAHLLWPHDRLQQAVMEFKGDLPEDEVEENFHVRDFGAYKRFVLDEYDKLNRLTARGLIALLAGSGFQVVRESYGRVPMEPPAELLGRFPRDDLVTEEVLLLLRKA